MTSYTVRYCGSYGAVAQSPDDERDAGVACEQAQPGVLDGIGILKLVNQDVLKALSVMLQQFGILQPQFVSPEQQLGEIHQTGTLAERLVGLVDLHLALQVRVIAGLDVLRPTAFVLAAVDKPLQLLRRPLGLVQVQRFQHPAHQPLLVLAVEDLETLLQSGLQPVGAQQAMRQAMKGPDPHAAGRCRDQLLDAPAHLAGRLVGEGNCQNGVG